MNAGPGSSNKNVILVVAIVLVGGCFFCGAGAVLFGGIGLFTAREAYTPPVFTGAPGTSEFSPPPEFQVAGEGRWRATLAEGSAQHAVEVIRLPTRAGSDGPATLGALWNETIVRDWPGAPTQVLPMRRFANNGARVYFASARLQHEGFRRRSLVSLYLVQADAQFEPFVVVQSSIDESAGNELTAPGAPDVTQPLVEALFKGIDGSPTGLPLVDDAELVGSWKASSGAQQQYVTVLTGASGYDAVASAVWWTFEDSHEFTYRFSGAVTDTGATQFSGQTDRGTWRVEHDLLVTDGEVLKRRYFIVGAGVGPSSKRVLVLLPEGKWSLSPSNLSREGVVLEQE